MARKTAILVAESKTFPGIKLGGLKRGFYFGVDPIPEELKEAVSVSEDGKSIRVECVESGYLTLSYGAFVAYEPDTRCDHGFNCWEKSNAPDTLVKIGNDYYAKGENVEIAILSAGSLPWFLLDEHAPELRYTRTGIEIMGSNGAWQAGTPGNAFLVYYNRESGNVHDVAIVDASTESGKAYHAIVATATAETVQIPMIAFMGTVA